MRPDEGFQLHGVDFDGDESVGPVYHNTPLSSLASHNPFAPGSCGILTEGGLRYGSGSHGHCSGVNFYLDGGLETFTPGGGWISLELYVVKATKLKGRKCLAHRYCCTGPVCEPCTYVEVRAVLAFIVETPHCMVLLD